MLGTFRVSPNYAGCIFAGSGVWSQRVSNQASWLGKGAGMPQIVQPIDWVSASKTFTLVLAFLGCIAAILTGHDTPDINTLTWGLGASLGILRLTDTVANLVTVRSYLANPNTANLSGLTPLPTSTPLVQTTQNGAH